MTNKTILDYCRSHDLTLLDGLSLISRAVKNATKTQNSIVPIENENGEISFSAQTGSGEFRAINMKQALLSKTSSQLAKLVQHYQSSKEVNLLQYKNLDQKIVVGTIDDQVVNGWFVNLPNVRAFMPLKKAVEAEANQGYYVAGQALHFVITLSGLERNGKPKVILSRKSALIAKAIAENLFAMYGYVDLKRKAGEKQTIIVRAYPQKHHQAQYQDYFPTERIVFHKLMPDGTIKKPERKRKREQNDPNTIKAKRNSKRNKQSDRRRS
ncbi:MAG: hypothetical protein LBQ52_03020 [Helicobacteraceae bacterium]|jgi:hypothetical protein|nr:hypothetical protein [Helicobacteraceae bacterium]